MKKRIVSALMAFALLFGSTVALPESVVTDSTSITASAEVNTDTSGKCGENVNWSLSGDGVLTISGTGKMYDYSYNTSPFYYRTDIKSVVINSGVTSVGNSAFGNCTNFTSISIPSSLISIGECAFNDCQSLSSVSIPSSVTNIGERAFQSCISLKNIIIPSSIKNIDNYTFNWCTNLESITIPFGVTSIGDSAFWHCISLTSISIPESVTSIGDDAFIDCESLISVIIPKSVSNIGGRAFTGTKWLENQQLKDPFVVINGILIDGQTYTGTTFNIPDGVKKIGSRSFEKCKNLYCITIPECVESIETRAFCECTNLNSVLLPDSIVHIGGAAFEKCTSLISITIPDNITSIEWDTFQCCSNLNSVFIPNSVISIGSEAFENCCELLSITIPNSVTSIGRSAFCNCSNLTSVNISSNVTSIGYNAFKNTKWLEDQRNKDQMVVVNGILIDGCTCSGDVTIPNTVTSIGSDAFYDCSSLTHVTIPWSVKNIGPEAFLDCTNLKFITIPSNVTSIGDNAIGYYYDPFFDDYDQRYKKVEGFTIKGLKDSAAEKYATDNGFAFEVLADLKITKQPTNVTVAKAGDTATFSVTASGTGLKYEWYVKDPGGSWIKTGATSNKYSVSVTAARDGRQVFCKVIDAYGNSARSNIVTATIDVQLAITAQPTNVTVAKAGDTASFSVTATGNGLKYEWYIKDIGGSWTKVGSTSNKYSVALKDTRNGRQVFCKVIDSTGTFVKSDIVTATIKGTVVITKQPTNVTVTKAGNTASFSVTALGSNLKYEWYIKDPGGNWTKTGATSNKYSVSVTAARNGRQVFCKVIDSSTKNFAKSNTVTAKIK